MASESDLFDQEGMTEEEMRIERMFEEADEYMINLKDFQKAKNIYQNIIKIDPNNIDAINSLSQGIQNLKEDSFFNKCKSLYDRSLEICPDDYMTNFYMGILYYKGKHNDRDNIMKALEYLLKAEASDSNTSVLYNIAVIYEEIGELHNAENYYLRILDINKTIDNNDTIKDAIRDQNLKVYNSLAVNSKKQGKLNQAIIYFKDGLKLDPNNFVFLYNLGLVYSKLCKHNQALKIFNKAVLSKLF